MTKRSPSSLIGPIAIIIGLLLLGAGGARLLFTPSGPNPAASPSPAPLAGATTAKATNTSTPPSPGPDPTPTATASATRVFTIELGASPISSPNPEPTRAAEPVVRPASALDFDGQRAYGFVLDQEALGSRPTGSEAGWATGDLIIQALDDETWAVETQEFFFKGVRGRNVIARAGQGPVIILGAHYDTRPVADQDPDAQLRQQPILGANDGASGVAVLLELANSLDTALLQHEVWLAFFDAEDRGRLDGWPFSVGARYLAQNLAVRPDAVIVVDMVGDADQNIFYELNSDPALSQEIWAVAGALGYSDYIIPAGKYAIIDDHTPFLELGIPAIDIIDFDYPYWHTVADTSDKVSPESLERVGRTLEAWLESR
ncbi:MAG: M28 family peptidase [Anaerolineae bacterium]